MKRFLAGLAAVTLVSSSLAPPGPAAARSKRRPNIVLIVIDTLRADHLPFYGYKSNTAKFLSRLAKEGSCSKRLIPTRRTLHPRLPRSSRSFIPRITGLSEVREPPI